jgi:hypothetical protein
MSGSKNPANIQVTKVVTLSAYGPTDYGSGHHIAGFLQDHPDCRMSVFERSQDIMGMLDAFKDLPLGTKIEVMMKADSKHVTGKVKHCVACAEMRSKRKMVKTKKGQTEN